MIPTPLDDISKAKFSIGQTVQPWGQYGKWGAAGEIVRICRACFGWSPPYAPRENTAIQYLLADGTSWWEDQLELS